MSIVLTAACRLFTMQVSDRLITEIRPADRATNQPGASRPFDALSNKSIVFRAQNAIVSMAYVGSAYLDGKPTDEWIAEQLWGEPLTDRTPDGRVGMRFGGILRSHDIGFSMKALQMSLSSLPPSPHGISVAAT